MGTLKCPHKSPSPRNNFHTHVIIHICYLINTHTERQTLTQAHKQTLSHKHVGFYGLQGLSVCEMVFILYKLCVIVLHLNLALTGDGAFLLSPQKTDSV